MIQTLEQPEVVGAVIERYKTAMRELHLGVAEMLDNTGGECGRDFTATEESIFNALCKQRDELALVFPSIALDIRYQLQDERRARHKAERDAANDPLVQLMDESRANCKDKRLPTGNCPEYRLNIRGEWTLQNTKFNYGDMSFWAFSLADVVYSGDVRDISDGVILEDVK